MSFTIGDTVRIIANTNCSINRIGDIGKIVALGFESGNFRVHVPTNPNDCNWTRPNEVELIASKNESGGTKHDSNKPRMELLPQEALEEIAKVLTFGAKKYDDNNWRKGFDYSRLIGASLRHIAAFQQNENTDPESGESHLAHAACCLLFLITHEKLKLGKDDRWTPGS